MLLQILMAMATTIPTVTTETVDLVDETISRQAADSLASYLGHVVINSRPEPKAWKDCIDPWQRHVVAPIIPAMEYMAGVRTSYDGPRNFFIVMPRGHDKTSLIARLANWAVAFSRQPISGVAAAKTRKQANLLLGGMTAEHRLNSWLAKRLTVQNYLMKGAGGKLDVIAADDGAAYGETPDLTVCDEFTWWDKNQALFDALWSARNKRQTGVFIIITNAGLRNTWQWDRFQDAQRSPNWHVYSMPEKTHKASWMSEADIAIDRAMVSRGTAKRVFDNIWADTTETPLLDFDLLATCFDSSCLWPLDTKGAGIMPVDSHPELYLGTDVGRTKHRSVIWIWERVGDVLWAREIFVMKGKAFREQRLEVSKRMTRFVTKAHIDKGGIGMQMAEELEVEFPGKIEGVQLSSGKQGQLAMALKTAFTERRVRIPDDVTNPDVTTDFQLIDEVDTANGSLTLKTNEDDTGHGDRFWAAALALYGVPITGPPQIHRLRPSAYVPKGIR